MVGLLGSVHCLGMCGGVVSALSMSVQARTIPIAVVGAKPLTVSGLRAAPATLALDWSTNFARTAGYNAGRIASYASAGAVAAGLFGGVRTLASVVVYQTAAYWLTQVMLILLGLYLMNLQSGLKTLESLGQHLWRRLQPLVGKLMPVDSTAKAIALGSLWGWVPCGMVYSMLLTAAFSGTVANGALTMLTFGLGTLPLVFAMGVLGARLRTWLQSRPVRFSGGLIVFGFGVLGILRAWHGLPLGMLDGFCVSPGMA